MGWGSERTSLAGEIRTRNFWLTGLAILRYIPRSLRAKRIDGMAFFTDGKYAEFRSRILQISGANPRQWGTMSVSQMLHHLNLACGGSLGFYTLPDESYRLSRTLFRWILADWFSEQPAGLLLPKDFKIPHEAKFEFDFKSELTGCAECLRRIWGLGCLTVNKKIAVLRDRVDECIFPD